MTTIPLDDAAATDPARCGHKAATLAALRQAGHAVPPGFVVPVGAAIDVDALATALAPLGGPVAVRSSGVAEDRPHASWAGQYDSVLGVEGPEAVAAAVSRVAASGRSDRARAYGRAGAVAVLVQRMVQADVAGVASSANPLTGDRDQVVVTAVRGVAARLAAGEVDGETWVLGARPEHPEAAVLTPEEAEAVAALARRLERERGAPQDVEWALADGVLHLLQARPLTALPVRPEIRPPPGTWSKDSAHYPGPITPWGASVYLAPFAEATRAMSARWGLLVDHVDEVVIGHEVYTRAVPFGGADGPAPPWWLLGLVVRVVPRLRRRLAAGRRAVDDGLLDAVPAEWERSGRGAVQAELAALQQVDLEALGDAAALAHLDKVRAFAQRCQALHFQLFLPYAVRLHELCVACRELLGWGDDRTMGLLEGLSAASSAPSRALAGLADRLRAQPAVRDLVRADPGWLQRLPEVDVEAAAAVAAYRRAWGWRTVEYDPGTPLLAERTDLFAALVRDAVTHGLAAPDQRGARAERVAAARAVLTGAARARFDRVLAHAEAVYPQREDNVVLADNLPSGLLRRIGLELGRRLAARDLLDCAEDGMMLTVDEVVATLRDGGPERRALARRRRAELAWVRAHPGPPVYGPEPGPPPDIRALPATARRLNGAVLWVMDLELAARPAPGATLGGRGASPGRYRGRVRVVRDAAELHRVRRGEVLVCPVTAPAWSVVFGQIGALVTDAGSILSHAAIVAREHGIPAVVAAGDATRRLETGMDVTVDGSTGAVTIHPGPESMS